MLQTIQRGFRWSLLVAGLLSLSRTAIADEAASRVSEARKLIADAIPEERAEAERLLIQALRLDAHSVDAYAELTRARLWEVGSNLRPPADLYEALEFADHVKLLAPDRPLGDYLRCETLVLMGRAQDAEKVCLQAEARFPNHVDTNVFLVRTLSDNKPKEAIAAGQMALSQGACYDEISAPLSTALSNANSGKSAGHTLAQFATVYPDRWVWHRAGLAFINEQRYKEAKDAFKKAIALGNTLESRLQLANLAAGKLKDYPLAIAEFKILLTNLAKQNSARTDVVAGIRSRLALVQLEMLDVKTATQTAAQAFADDPQNDRVMQVIFEAFARRKLSQNLKAAFAFVNEENPFLNYAHLVTGDLAVGRKDFPTAIAAYSNALGLQPEDDGIFAARGHAYYSANNIPMALQDFDDAIKFKPQDATHHYNRACMLSLLGKKVEAFTSLRTAIYIDRNLAQLASDDSDLADLRKSEDMKSQLAALGITNAERGTQTARNENGQQ